MAKLVFGMNQSLDGYVDHMAFEPSPALFVTSSKRLRTGGKCVRRQMYEIMRYWTTIILNGRRSMCLRGGVAKQPKWVVSRSSHSVGPNATLVGRDLEGAMRKLKADYDGEIEVAGPNLASSLTSLA